MKKFLSIALVILCAIALAACGEKKAPDTAETTTPVVEEKTEVSADKETEAPAEEETEAPSEETAEAPAGDTFKVTFDLNYEDAPEAQAVDVEAENAAEPPADPERSGYEFTGWFTDAEGTSEADWEVAIMEDTTFYAGWDKTATTITFDPNYEGAEILTAEAEAGAAVSTPATPAREGYLFTGWFTDAEATAEYDFSVPVSEDITLFAGWEEYSGTPVNVSYEWNVDGKGTFDTVAVKKLGYIKAPSLTLEGYYLEGWYTDEACTEKFDFGTRVREDLSLYANWLKESVFEAEFTDLTGLEGMGYSGNASGIKMIEDGTDRQASNDHYVGWLYNEGLTLTFHVVSSEADSNAKLALGLSAEFYDITLTDSNYTVAVNGQKVAYNDIVFDGVTQMNLPFRTFVLDSNVSLNEGDNVITLSVTNSEKKTGTIYATAPMVDALYIYSKADVTWAEGFPMTDNVK